MQRIFSIGLLLIFTVIASSSLSAQTTGQQQQQPTPAAAKKLDGAWAGAYEGDGSGKFEMIFSINADGKETGKLSVVPDNGDNYTVDLKTLSFDGTKMTATYTLPQGDDVTMEGTLDEMVGISGKWAVGPTGSSSATGTWKASKK